MQPEFPTGTVTFLLTDVEGSTRLLRELGPKAYAEALAEHREVVRAACGRSGVEVDTQGDAFFFAFSSASHALEAAEGIRDGLEPSRIRVRIGLHTGTPLRTEEGYVGDDVHLAARVAAAAHGGQVVVTSATRELVRADSLVDLGRHRLKDIPDAVSIFQLGQEAFPPLRTISTTNLPRPASSFVGRAEELAEVRGLLEEGARLVTLTGPGGSGKTRLALEAATSLVPSFEGGVFWVPLATVRDAPLVPETIAQVLGARDGLASHIGEREMLLVLDNLEQVVEAAPALVALLSECLRLQVLATSRELLRVTGEVEFAVPPLAEDEAVSLFCERARLEPSAEIREVCARLDSLPLAVELAAARAKALSPAQILARLSERLDLLRGGRDADPRQQTLRATIDWSHDLLSPEERQLFARLSVFAGGCTLDAAEQVAEADLDTLQSLVEKSLVRFTDGRYSMLETIREFAAERLDEARTAELRRRHRAFVVQLAEASAQQLHTGSESAVSARLAPEYANVRAAVSHALEAHEPDDVGRILGAIYPFLISRGDLYEAREWTEATLGARERLSSRGLADALVGGGEIARFSGDLARAVELKEELTSIEDDPQRPNWRAATLADLAEIALAEGDLERARRYAEESESAGVGPRVELDYAELALRGDELRSAERHAEAALAAFEPGSFNYACGVEILGEAARRSGNEALAAERFSAGLRLFADLNDGGGVADCLDGLARLAAATGDTDRAGRLCGAADELRRAWRRAPIRADVPLPDLPDDARAAGAELSLDEAVSYALGSVD